MSTFLKCRFMLTATLAALMVCLGAAPFAGADVAPDEDTCDPIEVAQQIRCPRTPHCEKPEDLPDGVVQGLRVTEEKVCGQPTEGYLCDAYHATVKTSDVYVYRLWGGIAPWSGRSWAFTDPGRYSPAAANAYRTRYAVCSQWNTLACLRKCKLRQDATLIYGTTQSADCGNGVEYDAQGSLQIFFVGSHKPFDSCEHDAAWKGGQRCTPGAKDY